MSKELVLYHDSCNDGFCAAWLWRGFAASTRGPEGVEPEFRAVQYGQPAPTTEEIIGADVVILDFSYPRAELERIHQHANSLLVLDHHKTAQEALAGLPYCVFDMNKSGAHLVWDYIYQETGEVRAFRWLVDYTEDRDLWRWKLPESKAVNAALASYPRDFEVWDKFYSGWMGPDEMAKEGCGILRYQEQLVQGKTDKGKVLYSNIDGYWVPTVNATCLISEVAGNLAEGEVFAACFFVVNEKEVVYSLRSRGELGIDVSEVAKKYGGGGHKNAAGFTSHGVLEMLPISQVLFHRDGLITGE